MLTVLVTLADGRSPAFGHLIQVTADLLFSAAKFPQTLLDLFDGRGRVAQCERIWADTPLEWRAKLLRSSLDEAKLSLNQLSAAQWVRLSSGQTPAANTAWN